MNGYTYGNNIPVKIDARLGEQLLTDAKALLNIKLRLAKASKFGV